MFWRREQIFLYQKNSITSHPLNISKRKSRGIRIHVPRGRVHIACSSVHGLRTRRVSIYSSKIPLIQKKRLLPNNSTFQSTNGEVLGYMHV